MITALLLLASLPLVAAAAIASMRDPIKLLAAYAVIVPFGSAFVVPIPLPGPFRTLTTILGLLVGVAVVVHVLVSRPTDRLPPAVGVWLLFAAVSTATLLWSVNQEATLNGLLVLLSLIGLYAAVALMPVNSFDVERVESGILLGGAITGLYAVYLLFTGGLPTTGPAAGRFQTAGGGGEDADPNITAASLLVPLAIAASRVLRPRQGQSRWANLAAAALIVAGIALTGSRGGLVGALVALVILAVLDGRRQVNIAIGVLVLATVVGTLALAPDIGERVRNPSSTGRTEIWGIGLRACPQHCWAGSGLGTFPDIHQQHMLRDAESSGWQYRYVAHNIWLGAAVEVGLVGMALMSLGLWLVGRDLMRLPRAVRGPPLAGLVAVVGSNIFLSNLTFKYFWLALIYATLASLAAREPSAPARPRHQPASLTTGSNRARD